MLSPRRMMCSSMIVAILAILIPMWSFAALTPEERVALEIQLAEVEQQITANKSQLEVKQRERTTLERDVAVVDAEIRNAKLAIKQRDLILKKLNGGISEKEAAIRLLDAKVAAGQESVASMIRRTREIDETTLVEIALSGTFGDIFGEIDQFAEVQKELDGAFKIMANSRADLASRKEALLDQQVEEQDLRQLQVLQQRTLQQVEREKTELVKVAKGQENLYAKVIATQQKTANEIKVRLFELRDSGAIPFGKAYEYAKAASALTGVRPAIILGILAEESNLGANVGSGNWLTDMHPTRDRPVFEEIAKELGFNPDEMKVSKKPWYGWGGAMGPSQFIPSTWVMYKTRVAKATGNNPPNPWDARTAIFATALLMMDNGADAQTRSAERKAALKYLAGGNWSKPAYAFYGDDVMRLSDKFQKEIDILEGK